MIREFNPSDRITLFASLCLALSMLTSLAEQASERVKVVRISGGAKNVKAQIGPDGTIHVLLDAEDGPRYVKSSDSGVSFSASMEIVDAASQKPGVKFQGEDLAIGKDGFVHVAMANNAWKTKL